MNQSSEKILLFGLPASGKTSFLAALVHYVDADIDGKNLRQYQLSSNTTYISSIVQRWLKGKKQERTKITASNNTKTVADLYLENVTSADKSTLHIPDFYGETFANQFFDRNMEIEILEQIKSSNGLLLFISPDKIKEPILIEEVRVANIVADQINEELESEVSAAGQDIPNVDSNTAEEILVQYDIEETPTQLVLIDLLEAHREYIDSPILNLAVVISAWDIVQKDMATLKPMKWIEITLPMLYQYLVANSEQINFRIFGISAQGGDIEDPLEIARLVALAEPADRIVVQEDAEPHKNIASPIEWLIAQWQQTIA
jgi:GTPase SAR1 family protein